jgi:multidrug efflux pump subunit AcrA (membrane-fusion protein)
MIKKIFKYIKDRKIRFVILIIIIVGGGYYYLNSKNKTTNVTSYTLGAVERGSIITSVSGSGQIAADNQLDIKPKVSGDIIKLAITSGQTVKTGDVIAQINSKDAAKAVSDARIALTTAKLDLDNLLSPADQLSLVQAEDALASAKSNLTDLLNTPSQSDISTAENALVTARDSLTKLKTSQASSHQDLINAKQNAQDDLTKAYESGFNGVSDTFLDLPTIMSGLNSLLFDYNFEAYQNNIDWYANKAEAKDSRILEYKQNVYDLYNKAKTAYDINFTDYRNVSRSSDPARIESIILETYNTSKTIAEAIKATSNYVDFARSIMEEFNFSIPSGVTTQQTALGSYSGTINGHISSLFTVKNSIDSAKQAETNADRSIKTADQNNPLDLAAAERSVKEKQDSLATVKKGPEQSTIDAAKRSVEEKQLSLDKLKAGADSYDIRTKKIAVQQKYDDLTSKQLALADYTIKSPIDGVIASVSANKGDTVGASTVIATVITKQQIANVTLNEVDAAKAKMGQKVSLTFNAIDGLTLTGAVAAVDNIGTVSQGVVSYSVKIALDTQDSRIKSQMSVAATIITNEKLNTLVVPSSAVQTDNSGGSYVQVFDNNAVLSQPSATDGSVTANTKPTNKTVTVGLSDDINTEILSGLNEGDKIITSTVNSAAKTTDTQGTSGLNILGGGGAGAGATRRFGN